MPWCRTLQGTALSVVACVLTAGVITETAHAQPDTTVITAGASTAALYTPFPTVFIPLELPEGKDEIFETYCLSDDTTITYSRFDSNQTVVNGPMFAERSSNGSYVLHPGIDWDGGAIATGAVIEEDLLLEAKCSLPLPPPGAGLVQHLIVGVDVTLIAYQEASGAVAIPNYEVDWLAGDVFFSGDVPCANRSKEIVDVKSETFAFEGQRTYTPLSTHKPFSPVTQAPLMRLSLDENLLATETLDVAFTCVSSLTALRYSTTVDIADLVAELGQVNDIAGQITMVKETPTFTTLQMTPCPAGGEISVGLVFDANDFETPPSHRSLIEDDVAEIELRAKTTSPDVIEVPVTVTCESDTQRVTGQTVVKFSDAEDDEPVPEEDPYDSYMSEVEGLPLIGSVSISPAVTTLGATVSAVPSGPCPDGTEAVGLIPARAMGDVFLRGDITDALFADLSEAYPVGADGNWSVSFTLGDDGLATEAVEIELIFVCGQAGVMTSRYDTASFVVGATEEAAAEFSEEPTGAGAASGGTSSGGSSSATPRFEVVQDPALSDEGAGAPSSDSADTADEAGAASARLFDFDIERQAIIDTSTGAIVGVYDEVTGNFVSPTDDSLIAVIDPSNGEVTVLASGEVVARVLAAAGDDAGDDDSGDSGSNMLAYVLIAAAALLLVLLGVFWLGARQRGGPPGGMGAAAPAAPAAPVASADTPPVTQQTPLPPPPPADPGAPPHPPA